jgi:hypothetical protein
VEGRDQDHQEETAEDNEQNNQEMTAEEKEQDNQEMIAVENEEPDEESKYDDHEPEELTHQLDITTGVVKEEEDNKIIEEDTNNCYGRRTGHHDLRPRRNPSKSTAN